MTYATTPQTDIKHCLVCGAAETKDEPFLAVLTPTLGRHHWLHLCCHETHVARCAADRGPQARKASAA